jgi:hypothetical protein
VAARPGLVALRRTSALAESEHQSISLNTIPCASILASPCAWKRRLTSVPSGASSCGPAPTGSSTGARIGSSDAPKGASSQTSPVLAHPLEPQSSGPCSARLDARDPKASRLEGYRNARLSSAGSMWVVTSHCSVSCGASRRCSTGSAFGPACYCHLRRRTEQTRRQIGSVFGLGDGQRSDASPN